MDPEIFQLIANSAEKAGVSLKSFARDIEEKVQPPVIALSALADPVAAFGEGMRQVTKAIPKLGPVVDNLTHQFEGMFEVAKAWVAALSPATINSLNYQLRNLQATLGQAFAPAMQIAIDAVNRFAGVINPVAQALAPAFHRLAEILALHFLDAARDVADLLLSWVPIIERMVENFSSFLDLLRAVEIVFAALAEYVTLGVKGMMGLTDTAKMFQNAHREAAKAVILFTAYLLRAVGAMGAIQGIIDRIGRGVPGEEGGALAAPQNVRIQDFASIASDMAKAAFAGGPGGERLKKPEDWLSEMKPILEDIRDKGLLGETNEMVKKFLVDAENWAKKLGPALDVAIGPVMSTVLRNIATGDLKTFVKGGFLGVRVLG